MRQPWRGRRSCRLVWNGEGGSLLLWSRVQGGRWGGYWTFFIGLDEMWCDDLCIVSLAFLGVVIFPKSV
jgi:hypothetical protein